MDYLASVTGAIRSQPANNDTRQPYASETPEHLKEHKNSQKGACSWQVYNLITTIPAHDPHIIYGGCRT
jgi:hypothetical protein